MTRMTQSLQSCRKTMWLCAPILLAALGQPVLAQSAIELALTATVIIEVDGPSGRAHGSGFVTSSDGMIVTAAHVIEGATSATVRFQNGVELDVEGVIDVDWSRDFAIVRVAGFDLPTVELGNVDDVAVGQRVIVIGAPIDPTLAGTVSDGLVAAIRMMDGTRHIQISAPTSPGNSGGPVMTEEGQVIGLVVSGINADGAENLNFALPINYVRGQLSLATTRPLQSLAEVQVTASAVSADSPTVPTINATSTQRPDLSRDPTYGNVSLDEGFWPDPHDVSLIAGGGIDVDVGSCSYGYVSEPPDVNFFYTTSGGANLYLYADGEDDTTLLVNKPDASWVCDDDGLGDSNPVVAIPGAADGLYNIWVGTYGSANTSATLHLSEIDPRGRLDSSKGQSTNTASGLRPDLSLDATYGTVSLNEGFWPDPHEVSLTAGGSIDVDVGSCGYGYVAEAPDVDFLYTTSGGANLYIYVTSSEDTTLLVNQPDASWICNDDSLGDSDPVLVIPSAEGGLYDIWVGTYGSGGTSATLYISEIDPR